MEARDKISDWYTSVKKMLFRHKDGFFELPIMSNSPETTLKSLAKMPFVKFNAKKHYYGTRNPILNVDGRFKKIEEGFWFMFSEANYKENVHYIRKSVQSIPSDYYSLFIEITRADNSSKHGLLNGMTYSNCSWVLLKMPEGNTHCRFKGNTTTSMVVYMRKDWIENVLANNVTYKASSIQNYLNSKEDLLTCSESITVVEHLEKIAKSKFKDFDMNKEISLEEWKSFGFMFIEAFLKRYKEEKVSENHYQISYNSRLKVSEAEQFLTNNLYGKFVGIEKLCKIIGVSPTKLKADFKLVFGISIFQYFRKKQMELARNLIQKREKSIAEIASILGYSNPSKFAVAYKDEHGVLPSNDKI